MSVWGAERAPGPRHQAWECGLHPTVQRPSPAICPWARGQPAEGASQKWSPRSFPSASVLDPGWACWTRGSGARFPHVPQEINQTGAAHTAACPREGTLLLPHPSALILQAPGRKDQLSDLCAAAAPTEPPPGDLTICLPALLSAWTRLGMHQRATCPLSSWPQKDTKTQPLP